MEAERLWEFPIKEFHNVPRGLLGPGAYELVGVEAKNLGFKKSLLMTSGLRGTGIIDDIVGKVKHAGVDVAVFDKVESNPKDYNVMDAHQMYVDETCDSFISVGGGSTHDACKGARIVAAHDGRNINEFEGFNKSENPINPPHIAISTTAGTGSETSWAYVITDTSDKDSPHKYVGFDDRCIASLAICDPVMYYDLPQDYTAQCGFDVLAHASEPYVSRLDFAPSLGQALWAIQLTAKHLRTAYAEPKSYDARMGMMYAQYIAAQAFNSGGLGIIHSISHAVSAFYDTHHGLNNAVALPRVWEYNLPSRYERFADIAVAMGVERNGKTTVQMAEAALEAAIQLLKDVNITENFTSVKKDTYSKNRMDTGVYEGKGAEIKGDADDIHRVAVHIMGDACTPGNPRECTVQSLTPVVKETMVGTL
ncbi:MAG: NDMA-dependent methanol dehydrogenase [Solirubrobacterales bacterium]|nr:NDMA-dependent methanol dehydrogenase [Solirubrobacterales bacterium]